MPVMRWVGMSEVSMSTVKICEVMERSPPFLYKSCLNIWDETFHPNSLTPAHVHHKKSHSPVFSARLEADNPQARVSAPHDTQLLSYSGLLLRRGIDEENKILRRVIDLKELAYDTPQSETASKKNQLRRSGVMNLLEDGLMEGE